MNIAFKFPVAFSLVLLSVMNGYAQTKTNINDTNIIYKSIDGTTLTKDSAIRFMRQGSFNIKEKNLGNGKREITVYHESREERDKKLKAETEKSDYLTGKPFPSFSVTGIDGKQVDQSVLLNKISVINFWFIGCQPCQAEMPELNKLKQYYAKDGINFLAFTFDDKDAIMQFFKRTPFNYTQLPGAGDLIKALSVNAFPTHMIVDKNGVIRKILIGADKDIYKTLSSLVEEERKTL